MLNISNLTVFHGSNPVVKNLNFQVQEGQWLMIVGPNGAGKSTILNAITQGLHYTGDVFFDNKNIKTIKPSLRARQIGILSQHHNVSYEFSVEEIVQLGRYSHSSNLLNGKKDDDKLSVEKALEMTGMAPKAKHSVLTLSGGELQRTFLAQVFAQNPRLLLLDEPTNHLDLVYQKQVFGLIQKWLETPGRAVVSVVHDLSLAKAFGSDALLMHNGSSVMYGNVKDVISSSNLDPVYGMDVCEWMQKMFSQWCC